MKLCMYSFWYTGSFCADDYWKSTGHDISLKFPILFLIKFNVHVFFSVFNNLPKH